MNGKINKLCRQHAGHTTQEGLSITAAPWYINRLPWGGEFSGQPGTSLEAND